MLSLYRYLSDSKAQRFLTIAEDEEQLMMTGREFLEAITNFLLKPQTYSLLGTLMERLHSAIGVSFIS